MSAIDTRKVWRVNVGTTIVSQTVVADSLSVSEGCLVFTEDGVVVQAFARGAWLAVQLSQGQDAIR